MNYQVKPLSHWKRYSPTEARNLGECATPRQLVNIRSTGNSQRIDFEDAAKVLFGCRYEELNKRAASTFIEWLKAQYQRRNVSDPQSYCPQCQGLQISDGKQAWCPQKHVYEIASIEAA